MCVAYKNVWKQKDAAAVGKLSLTNSGPGTTAELIPTCNTRQSSVRLAASQLSHIVFSDGFCSSRVPLPNALSIPATSVLMSSFIFLPLILPNLLFLCDYPAPKIPFILSYSLSLSFIQHSSERIHTTARKQPYPSVRPSVPCTGGY